MEKKQKYDKNRILKLEAKGRIFAALGAMILLSILINTMIGWFERPEELHSREEQKENAYDPEAFFLDEKGRLCYEDKNWTSYICADVSSYQNQVDWRQVAADGVEFAMIRLGYRGYSSGQLNLDPCYEQNVKGARDAGLHVGVYFFSQAKDTAEAVEEAQYVLYEIKDFFVTMPVVFDMEEVTDNDRIKDLTDEDRTEIAAAFCRTIRDAGYIPMVYGSENWLSGKILMQDLQDDFIFWLASYHEVSVSTDFPFVFDYWQYYNRTEIPGIDTETDINIHFIRKSE